VNCWCNLQRTTIDRVVALVDGDTDNQTKSRIPPPTPPTIGPMATIEFDVAVAAEHVDIALNVVDGHGLLKSMQNATLMPPLADGSHHTQFDVAEDKQSLQECISEQDIVYVVVLVVITGEFFV